MDNKPSFYKRAVDTFGVPPEKAEKIVAQMVALGVDRDDEYMLLFLATGRIEYLVEALPASIRSEGAKLIENMGLTVSAALDEKLSDIPSKVRKDLSAVMETSLGDLVKNVNVAVNREASQRFKDADRNYELKRAGVIVGGCLAVLIALGLGYVLGRDTVTTDAARWSSVVNLEDGGKWLALARLNDLDKVLAQTCGPSAGRIISGGKVCDLTMFVTQPVGTSKGVDLVWLSLSEYANKFGWGGYAIVGLLGAGLGWAFARRKRAY